MTTNGRVIAHKLLPLTSRVIPPRALAWLIRCVPLYRDPDDGWSYWMDVSYARYVRRDRRRQLEAVARDLGGYGKQNQRQFLRGDYHAASPEDVPIIRATLDGTYDAVNRGPIPDSVQPFLPDRPPIPDEVAEAEALARQQGTLTDEGYVWERPDRDEPTL
jgi:hypothetical protein